LTPSGAHSLATKSFAVLFLRFAILHLSS
jgi:hypothetical protein